MTGRLLNRGARDVAYLLATFLTSILSFAVWVTGVTVSLVLAITVLGLFAFIATAYAFRLTAQLDRRLAALVRGEPVGAAYRTPSSRGWWVRLRTVVGDPQTWKDLAWLIVNSTLGFGLSLAALTVLVSVVALIAMPAWWWALPSSGDAADFGIYQVNSWGSAALTSAIGIALLPLAYLILRGAAKALSGLAQLLLGPSESQRLSARVAELTTTRADVVDATRLQLERVERDLHDGAQARMVTAAMDLGLAEERLAQDPVSARALIGKAREDMLTALADLRDLARGIKPALLTERGLVVAIEALAERSPVPAAVGTDDALDDGLSEAVETAAYFVVAEALTNAVKHSGASRIQILLQRDDGRLVVLVEDDGNGGANERGSGLSGLAKRVRGLDGQLDITSPAGGPTEIRAELPCGS